MTKFEHLEMSAVPFSWHNSGMILPTSMGNGKTIYPYFFSRKEAKIYLILYTLSGTGCLKYNENEYQLNPGDLFFIDCFSYQEYFCVSKRWDFSFFHINENSNNCELIKLYYNMITKSGKAPVLHCPTFYTDFWDTMSTLSKSDDTTAPAKASICFLNLLLTLLSVNESVIPENITNTVDYIKKHYSSCIALETLADIAHLSKFYFIREFKKFYRITPHEYIINYRIDIAKSLLISSGKNIEEISCECGFSSLSSFSLCFKKITGNSPAAYRNNMRMI